MAEDNVFSKIDHIAVVVRDMEKAIKYYESLGIGPFRQLKNIVAVSRVLRGKSIPLDSIKVDARIARIGPVDLELLQPVKGDSLWKESLEANGEGCQHLGFWAEDIDGAEAKAVEKGLKVLYKVRFEKDGGDSYMDTAGVGGLIMALSHTPSQDWPPRADDNKRGDRSPFSKVDQIGIIVRDLDKAVEYYKSLGFGPFESLGITITERMVYGKTAPDVKNRQAITQIGQIELELVQPVSGKSVQQDFLDTKGEGVNHLGYFIDTDDFDKEVAKMLKKGYKIVSGVKTTDGFRDCAYFDTDKTGGIQLEFIRKNPRRK